MHSSPTKTSPSAIKLLSSATRAKRRIARNKSRGEDDAPTASAAAAAVASSASLIQATRDINSRDHSGNDNTTQRETNEANINSTNTKSVSASATTQRKKRKRKKKKRKRSQSQDSQLSADPPDDQPNGGAVQLDSGVGGAFTQGFSCDMCGKTFSKRKEVRKHKHAANQQCIPAGDTSSKLIPQVLSLFPPTPRPAVIDSSEALSNSQSSLSDVVTAATAKAKTKAKAKAIDSPQHVRDVAVGDVRQESQVSQDQPQTQTKRLTRKQTIVECAECKIRLRYSSLKRHMSKCRGPPEAQQRSAFTVKLGGAPVVGFPTAPTACVLDRLPTPTSRDFTTTNSAGYKGTAVEMYAPGNGAGVESGSVRVGETKVLLRRFEGTSLQTTTTHTTSGRAWLQELDTQAALNAGAEVRALAVHPGFTATKASTLVAVGVKMTPGMSTGTHGLVQLWRVDHCEGDQQPSAAPSLVAVLEHGAECVCSLAWHPTAVNTRRSGLLGVLACALGDGSVYIVALKPEHVASSEHPRVVAHDINELTVYTSSTKDRGVRGIARQLVWNVTGTASLLALGQDNGGVSVLDLSELLTMMPDHDDDTEILVSDVCDSNSDVGQADERNYDDVVHVLELLPPSPYSATLNADMLVARCGIRALAWCVSDANVVAALDTSGHLMVFDLRTPSTPIFFKHVQNQSGRVVCPTGSVSEGS
jgi:hypothetical protein